MWYRGMAPARPRRSSELERGSVGDVLLGDHLAHVHPGLGRHLHDHVAAEHVAGVVEHQQQHAVALVRHLDGLEHQLGIGRGKHVAHHLDVQHALAHEARTGQARGRCRRR